LNTVRSAPIEHWPWFLERTGYAPSDGFQAIEAVNAAGRIVGMVGYDHWSPRSVQMHVALERPGCCRRLLREAFRYPFELCGIGCVVGITGLDSRSARMAERLGFREVGRAPNAELVFWEMRRNECPWILQSERRAA
jgi:L-amino acid N-acyltransferase YncA